MDGFHGTHTDKLQDKTNMSLSYLTMCYELVVTVPLSQTQGLAVRQSLDVENAAA